MAGSLGKVAISHSADDIISWLADGAGTALTSTLVGSKQSLDVNVSQSALPAGAATETTLAGIKSDIESLMFNEDDPAVDGSKGFQMFAQRNDAGTSLVSADGDLSLLSLDANGALRVTASVSFTAEHNEDSASVDGDSGIFGLGVRNDNMVTTLTSANGDYGGMSIDKKGVQYVKQVYNASNLQQALAVGTTAVQLPSAPLADRATLYIQNSTDKNIYIGSSSVTNVGATRGLLLGKGAYISVDAGPNQAVYAIASAAGGEVLVWEMA